MAACLTRLGSRCAQPVLQATPLARHLSATAAAHKDLKKIMVANRGEIACRVMRTCQKLDIQTVALYSEADANALHVRMADEAYLIGPPPSAQSYLQIEKILDVIKESGADGVHPGYGFLSENSKFSGLLAENNVAFIGPDRHAIEVMGDKLESKQTAIKAGVNTVPGFEGEIETVEDALKHANDIGYPVMIKASAGGGGKGMRFAFDDQEVRDGFRFSKDEAKSSFGDDRLLIEKYIQQPRHIEIQVLCDGHGNAIYLNERECSIQRRNQKVVEEAPSTFLDEATRKAMGEQACQLARAVDYKSAGTVEFLVDPDRNFYFLEMNTRLQVEHPITEAITGVDLVEQMIRVAEGKKLSYTQDDIGIHGWAIESRVYAEDPTFFLPSTGFLKTYVQPSTSDPLLPGVRVDTGVVEGSEISMYYDPMICKLVTHGSDRASALAQMNRALDSYVIKGVNHNIPILRDIINQPRFVSGDTNTDFLPDVYPDGFLGTQLEPTEQRQLIAAAAFMSTSHTVKNQRFVNQRDSTVSIFYPDALVVTVGEEQHTVHVSIDGDFEERVTITFEDGESLTMMSDWVLGTPLMYAQVDGVEDSIVFQNLGRKGDSRTVGFKGTKFDVVVRSKPHQDYCVHFPEKEEQDMSSVVVTPMPGTLVSVAVAAGDQVVAGQEVAVVEAMKMQNCLVAPKTGKIKAVNASAGQTLAEAEVIMEFEDEEDEAAA